jgi:hypothetical protein
MNEAPGIPERAVTTGNRVNRTVWLWLAPALLAAGCADSGTVPDPAGGAGGGGGGGGPSPALSSCTIPTSEIFSAGPKDGIPALTDPVMVGPGDPRASYLLPEDRVIGLTVGDEVVAIPLNILWWHEIVNLSLEGRLLAVTHCPLTGSSLVFNRASASGAEFGVSGLLYRNNLVMYNRTTSESLWPQMSRGARCGPSAGGQLTMYPAVEMTWEGWRTLHPETRVVGSETGHSRSYNVYPYGFYDIPDNPELLFQQTIDPRRPPKERVLGIPGRTAYPFGELAELGDVGVTIDFDFVVMWDGRRDAATAFRRTVGEQRLTFKSEGGAIVDLETGSVWGVDGLAVDGPLEGERLPMIPEAYVAYWFAWADFEPSTSLWEAP